MARRKRATADHGGGGGHGGSAGRWLVSYADFITLMFVVFVVLNSFSQMNSSKFASLARSLRSAIGPVGPDLPPLPARGLDGVVMPVMRPDRPGDLPNTPDFPLSFVRPRQSDEPIHETPVPPGADAQLSPTPVKPEPEPAIPKPPAAKPDALAQLQGDLQRLPMVSSGAVAVALNQLGLQISIATEVLFEPGKAELRPQAKATLAQVAGQLRNVEFPLEIAATADGSGGGDTAFKLSADRTVSVYDYLVQEQGFERTKLHGAQAPGTGSGRVTILVLRRQP